MPKKKHKTSEILRESLKYLWNGVNGVSLGRSRFICFSVNMTKMTGRGEVIYEIERRLGFRLITLENWLTAQGIPRDDLTSERMQNYRKRWVLSMIKEFEAKGD